IIVSTGARPTILPHLEVEPFYLFVAWQRHRISRWVTQESCGQFFSQKAEDWLDQQEEEANQPE
ncbi:MAG: hypothetical protein AABZ60_03240, partial [Planctomycetota bacterium]